MSTNPKPNRTTHDLEFKKQAVQLLNTSGRPLAQIARELGLPARQLRDWKRRFQPQLDQQPETLEVLRQRLAQLERDNFQLRQQRDILKKLLALSRRRDRPLSTHSNHDPRTSPDRGVRCL